VTGITHHWVTGLLDPTCPQATLPQTADYPTVTSRDPAAMRRTNASCALLPRRPGERLHPVRKSGFPAVATERARGDRRGATQDSGVSRERQRNAREVVLAHARGDGDRGQRGRSVQCLDDIGRMQSHYGRSWRPVRRCRRCLGVIKDSSIMLDRSCSGTWSRCPTPRSRACRRHARPNEPRHQNP
jgi:hypothetical protein